MQAVTQSAVLFGLLSLSIALFPSRSVSAETLLPPQQVIQHISDQIHGKLQDQAFTQNFLQVTQFVNSVIDPYTDFDRISPLVLGKHWKTASSQEKQRFKQEFQTLLVRTYSRAFVEYRDWTLRFMPLDFAAGANKVIVKTEVLQPGLNPVEVNYRMFLSQGKWQVYDIVIAGVSLVTNYRSSINEDIRKKGSLTAVIDGLAKRNAEALKSRG